MRVIKCDNCKKKINTNGDAIDVRIGFYTHAELCKVCGKQIYDLLAEMKLLQAKDFEKFLK